MKIEAVDKRNPILIRVATVTELDGHLLKLHFDEWDECYDYWVEDDCPDIHPPGWCHKTGHPLTAPPSKCWPSLLTFYLYDAYYVMYIGIGTLHKRILKSLWCFMQWWFLLVCLLNFEDIGIIFVQMKLKVRLIGSRSLKKKTGQFDYVQLFIDTLYSIHVLYIAYMFSLK